MQPTYLADEYGAQSNADVFRVFKDSDDEYLSRVWLRDPIIVSGTGNGAFYPR